MTNVEPTPELPKKEAEEFVSPNAVQYALVAVTYTKEAYGHAEGEIVSYDKNSAHVLVSDENVATYVDEDYTFVPDEDYVAAEAPSTVQANLVDSTLAQSVLTPAGDEVTPEAKSEAEALAKAEAEVRATDTKNTTRNR